LRFWIEKTEIVKKILFFIEGKQSERFLENAFKF
jgi:hypothetical protein